MQKWDQRLSSSFTICSQWKKGMALLEQWIKDEVIQLPEVESLPRSKIWTSSTVSIEREDIFLNNVIVSKRFQLKHIAAEILLQDGGTSINACLSPSTIFKARGRQWCPSTARQGLKDWEGKANLKRMARQFQNVFKLKNFYNQMDFDTIRDFLSRKQSLSLLTNPEAWSC